MTAIDVEVKRLPHGADLPLPQYATADSAGLDLLAAVDADLVIQPGMRALVPTGLAIALPPGYEAPGRRGPSLQRWSPAGRASPAAGRGARPGAADCWPS
jgi:dUTPase